MQLDKFFYFSRLPVRGFALFFYRHCEHAFSRERSVAGSNPEFSAPAGAEVIPLFFASSKKRGKRKANRGREFDLSPAKKSSPFSPSLELLVFWHSLLFASSATGGAHKRPPRTPSLNDQRGIATPLWNPRDSFLPKRERRRRSKPID